MAGGPSSDCGIGRRAWWALLGFLLLIGAASTEAQSPIKQVLVLQSLDRGNLQVDQFTGDFRVGLDRRAGQPVNVVQVIVGPLGSMGAPERRVVDYIRSIYEGHAPPDLIMTISGPAAVFARKYRRELFSKTPLLLASVDQHWLGDAPVGENEAAVAVENDYPRVIDEILRVLPDTKQVFMVIGAGPIGRFWHRELETEFSRFGGRVTFIWSDELALREILLRAARLPTNSAILYLTFGTDGQGGAYADEQMLADLHATANAPIFGSQSPLLGHGIVGGSMIATDKLARSTVDVAMRIVNGESPANIKIAPVSPTDPTYDWRELNRWGIPESRLLRGSIVKYRDPTLWEQHKVTVLTVVAALILQSFLIALMLYERRARQRAEIESRKNLDLAADANRRETISALATSIGHELGQPLSAIAHNAQALQRLVAANRPRLDPTADILDDIKADAVLATQIIARHRSMLRSHQLLAKPTELRGVIDDSLALLAHELRTSHIEAIVDMPSTPCVIDGDEVLLKQVFVNLIRNATEALADRPPANRLIAICGTVSAAQVDISVRDTGTGLSADVADTLFTPFFTTKSHGLGIGLTIAQRILEAHGGAIAARGNPNGGATFTVTLPRAAASVPRWPQLQPAVRGEHSLSGGERKSPSPTDAAR